MRFIMIAAAVVVGLSLLGWITFANSEDSASITLDKEEAKYEAQEAVEKTENALNAAEEEAEEVYEEAKEEGQEVLESTEEALQDAEEETKETFKDVQEEFTSDEEKNTNTDNTKETVESNS